jgi:hypothetical protein
MAPRVASQRIPEYGRSVAEGGTELKAKRIQRKRTKGWKMPDGAVYVGRPSIWGNPFPLDAGWTREESLIKYRMYLPGLLKGQPGISLSQLRGKDLACWCKLSDPCHADILLELANS